MPKQKKPDKGRQSYTPYDDFRDPVLTAAQYGFTPKKHLTIQDQDRKIATQIDNKETHETEVELRHVDLDTKEKAALLREALDQGAQGGQPYMVYFEKELKNNLMTHVDIIGNSNGVAEGIIIATGIAMLKDAGLEDPTVSINCVGDKDSSQRFMRALAEYYK